MNSNKKKKIRNTLVDVLGITVGCFLFAVAFDVFLDPNGIAPGGVTGLAMVINRWLPVDIPIGVLALILNIPLFIAGWRHSGRDFLIKSIFGTVLSSVFIDLLAGIYVYTEDAIMAAIFGGVLMGAGVGLVFTRGATTGGSDIVGRLLRIKFPHISMGRLILVVDVAIILLAAATFGHVNYALYSILVLYVSSTTIDAILYGLDTAKMAYVITDRHEDIAAAIGEKLERGATILKGEGAYTGKNRHVIMVAIKKQQIAQLKEVVTDSDPDAFMIIVEAKEVLGEEFSTYDKNAF